MSWFVAALIFLAVSGHTEDVAVRIDEYIKGHVQIGRFSGAILVARDGKTIVSKGYGLANREHEAPNTPQTKFRLGSITKPFTAMAIMQLEEKGSLSLQHPVHKYMTDAPEAWRKITVHHLLTHTSGIPNLTSFPDFRETMMIPSPVLKTIARFKDKPLEFEPGEKFRYSNSGYVVLGYIIEQASGQSYETYLQRNIFEPLKMVNSGYDSQRAVLKHRASGYARQDGAIVNASYIDMSIPIGGGALYSTVEDMYLWDQALYTEKLVPKKSLEKMFTPFKADYGYGWGIRKQFDRKLIAHSGGINGFTSFFGRFPDERVCVVVLSNLESDATSRIGRDLAAMVFGEKYEMPKERTAIKLDPKIYDAYVGRYEIRPQFILTITRDGDRLMGQATGQPAAELFPESETKFFLKVVDAQMTFVKNEQGQVTQLVLHQGGRDMPAKKLSN